MNVSINDTVYKTQPVYTTDFPSTTTHIETREAISYIFFVYYGVVFMCALFGNLLIILSVCKFTQMRNVVNVFLSNLALADLTFMLLSTFDSWTFLHGKWIFGDVACRIQGTLIEVSYTVSICTLTVVAFERYLAICYPLRPKRKLQRAVKTCALLWLFSLLFCACLFYGYHTTPDDNNSPQCRNDFWSKKIRLLFYAIHSIVVYLLPLLIMVFAHVKISRALANRDEKKRKLRQDICRDTKKTVKVKENGSTNIKNQMTTPATRDNNRKSIIKGSQKSTNYIGWDQKSTNQSLKIVRLLVTVTMIFFILWTPFIVLRLIQYIGVYVNFYLWKASQLLVFGNTAVNCVVYSMMSPQFRTAFKNLVICRKNFFSYS